MSSPQKLLQKNVRIAVNALKAVKNIIAKNCKSYEGLKFSYSDVFRLSYYFIAFSGLGLDPNYFDELHSKMGTKGNLTTLRCLYYPELKRSQVKDIKPGQLRCGEHADFG